MYGGLGCNCAHGLGDEVWGVNADLLDRGYDGMGDPTTAPVVVSSATPTWVLPAGLLLGLTTAGYFGGRAISKKNGGLIGGAVGALASVLVRGMMYTGG